MSHTSPATYLVWSIIACMLGGFLLFHLWSFDKFKCLKWNSGPYSGAFKRVMTYSYMLSIPLIGAFAIGNAVIKYQEGFVAIPGHGVVPKPYQLWEPGARKSIFPLMLCFSIAWSLEMVTHLEELCFWLYLVNSNSSQQDWFKSMYFKTWIIGSCLAVTYMPLVTIFTRADPLKSEAYTFLAGSLGSLSLTLWFTPILYMFPNFLKNLRSEGVDMATVIRLTNFEELNRIRVFFRFLFCVPLLILGIDGVRLHHHVNESMLGTDLLAMIAAAGCGISSGITLLIFFPRSIEGEIAARDAEKERKRSRTGRSVVRTGSYGGDSRVLESRMNTNISETYSFSQPPQANSVTGGNSNAYLLTSSPIKTNFNRYSHPEYESDNDNGSQPGHEPTSGDKMDPIWVEEGRDKTTALPPIRPNRRRGKDVEIGGFETLSESNLSIHNLRTSNVNPMVHGFTSPINFGATAQTTTTPQNTVPRYSFRK